LAQFISGDVTVAVEMSFDTRFDADPASSPGGVAGAGAADLSSDGECAAVWSSRSDPDAGYDLVFIDAQRGAVHTLTRATPLPIRF
jgi:hypothetical protein